MTARICFKDGRTQDIVFGLWTWRRLQADRERFRATGEPRWGFYRGRAGLGWPTKWAIIFGDVSEIRAVRKPGSPIRQVRVR